MGDTSIRLESDRLVPTSYDGNQQGAGLVFHGNEISVRDENNTLFPLRISRAETSLPSEERKWYAVTHDDLQQELEPVAWVHVVVNSNATTEQIQVQLNGQPGRVFFRQTGAIKLYATDGSSQDTLYKAGHDLPKPLVVVHMPSGTVYTVSGTIGEGTATVDVVSSKERYTAVAYERDITVAGVQEFVFQSTSKTYTKNLSGADKTIIDALPKWEKLNFKELRGKGLSDALILVENVGLCRITDHGTNNSTKAWVDDVLIPWVVLRETNAYIQIRDAANSQHYYRSALSQHTLQVTSTGVHLLVRPRCSSNLSPIAFEHYVDVTNVSMTDTRYSPTQQFEDVLHSYMLGPVTDFNADTKRILQHNGEIRTLALSRVQESNTPVLDSDGVPTVILKTWTYSTDGSIGPSPGVTPIDAVNGLPRPLEYENDDLSTLVLEVAIREPEMDNKTRVRIVKLLWISENEMGIWTVAPSYLFENAWSGQDTVSHLRVVGGRDAVSTRTGDIVVAGGIGVGGTVWCHSVQTLSCASRKIGITALHRGLDVVRQMLPASFRWKGTGQPETGFIAQDLAKVVPHSVHTDPVSGTMSVNYNSLMPYLCDGIQELDKRIERLESAAKRARIDTESS